MTPSAADLLKTRLAVMTAFGVTKPPDTPWCRPVLAHDTSLPTRPLRTLRLAPSAEPAVLVETTCARPQLVERIALLARDADLRLSQYAIE